MRPHAHQLADGNTIDPNAGINTPAMVYSELMEEIRAGINGHGRSQQRRIGPSGIGNPCTRALIHEVMGERGPDRTVVPWKPTVGTAIHAWLEDVFKRSPAQRGDVPRYLLEQRVDVGEIDGQTITGSGDLFDVLSGTVLDWKSKGKTTLQTHRRHGDGQLYRVQKHLYGRGYQRRGYQVNTVMNIYLPRDGELSDAVMTSEPYDESIAIAALDRATGLAQLAKAMGTEAAAALYPSCHDADIDDKVYDPRYCDWCTPTAFTAPAPSERPSTAQLLAAH